MLITSLSGKRSLSVARVTRDRVIRYIANNPGKTVVDYANALLVAEVAINLIIGRNLLFMVAAGQIAISERGRKPEWYFQVPNPSVIPQRKSVAKLVKLPLVGITDKHLQQDYSGLTTQYNIATVRTLSPARRRVVQQEFAARVSHVGGHHQETIDRSDAEMKRLEGKIHGLVEAVQLLSAVVTNAVVKTAA
jgi:hypothetical protein